MYASVIGLYALKQDTNADIADAFAQICLTVSLDYIIQRIVCAVV
jgi:hypothetical protein